MKDGEQFAKENIRRNGNKNSRKGKKTEKLNKTHY